MNKNVDTYRSPLSSLLLRFFILMSGQSVFFGHFVDGSGDDVTSSSSSSTSRSGDTLALTPLPSRSSLAPAFLNLSSSFISTCLHQLGRHSFRLAEAGEVSYRLDSASARRNQLPGHSYRQFCIVNVTAQERMVVRIRPLQMTVPCCSARFQVDDYAASFVEVYRKGCGPHYRDYISKSNALTLRFNVNSFAEDVVVRLSMTSHRDERPALEVVWTSAFQGYVQSPVFDGHTARLSDKMDSWARLHVPDLHNVMVSFPHVDIEAFWQWGCELLQTLHVYTFSSRRNRKTLLWKVCNAHEPPPPSTLTTDAVWLHFLSLTKTSITTGFRVFFSFHNQSQTPLQQQTAEETTWNCSVSYWPRFKHHLECNLKIECASKKDESQCAYTSPRCGAGMIAVGDSCYVYVTANETVTWYEASMRCLRHGGHLASLNTPQEWGDVMGVLTRRPNVIIYLGLQSAPSTAPHIYHDTLMWMDQSVAYYRQVFNITTRPFCSARTMRAAVLPELWLLHSLMTLQCNIPFTNTFLCEMHPSGEDEGDDEHPDSTSSSLDTDPSSSSSSSSSASSSNADHVPVTTTAATTIPAPEVSLNSSRERRTFTVCPAGHVTHSFLSCDRHSACWRSSREDGVMMSDMMRCQFPAAEPLPLSSSSSSSSPQPLPPPPDFRCVQGGGAERVPYSLVCDFRPDCGDGSDEGFCVYPACKPLLHFDCGNRQCVSRSAQCDGVRQCVNGVDEAECYRSRVSLVLQATPPPALVRFTEDGRFTLHPLGNSTHGNITTLHPHHPGSSRGSADNNGSQSSTQSSSVQDPEPHVSPPLASSGAVLSTAEFSTPEETRCPESHFACPHNSKGRLPAGYYCYYYCLPVYVRCNGVFDCPGREDEDGCAAYTCPGLYRCRGSRVCLHPSQVCDSVSQCPQQDDELLCDLVCPDLCTCYGLAFYCHAPFPAGDYSRLRFLDASWSGTTPGRLLNNTLLVHLILRYCRLKRADGLNFPSLQILDLSDNQIRDFHHVGLSSLGNLRELSLASNPVQFKFMKNSDSKLSYVPSVLKLDLSRVPLEVLDPTLLTLFPSLKVLNLSHTHLQSVSSRGLQPLTHLRVLDVRGCPLTSFPRRLFRGLSSLRTVHADNYKLCCPAMLPEGFNTKHCHAPFDEIASCEDLLRSHVYRVVLALFACLALLGNLATFGYRTFLERASRQQSYGVFVHHLSVSDFCMGVYLALLGVADRRYHGRYVLEDASWRQSAACRMAGFVSLLSSEVSVCLVCVITMDRLLVLHCPFTSLRFNKTTAHLTCCVLWTAGLVVSAVPLLPPLSQRWGLYGHNAICVPLPVSRRRDPGHTYSFSVMVVFNFAVFLLIALGQGAIYWAVRRNSLVAGSLGNNSSSTGQGKDLTIARRLLTVAMTDFLGWFPVSVIALLASAGYSVSGEVSVALAMLVLPLNSAINPFLYTLNILLERRQRAREKRLLAVITAQLKAKVADSLDARKARKNVTCVH